MLPLPPNTPPSSVAPGRIFATLTVLIVKTVQDRYSYFGGKDPWEWTIHQTFKQFLYKRKVFKKIFVVVYQYLMCFFLDILARPIRESSSQMVFVLWSKTWSMSGSAKFQGNFRLLKRKKWPAKRKRRTIEIPVTWTTYFTSKNVLL